MGDPSFLLDGMLGSLARWLRILGYDAVYVRDIPDREMLALLKGNQRFLVTRDRQLAERAGARGLYLDRVELNDQIALVIERFDLKAWRSPLRCTSCNGELAAVEKGSVQGKVHPSTFEGHEEFWECRQCGRVYWRGAHWKSIRARVDRLSRGRGNSPR